MRRTLATEDELGRAHMVNKLTEGKYDLESNNNLNTAKFMINYHT